MCEESKTVLEWTYNPADFFEEPCTFSFSGGEITISEGEVKGEFDGSNYDQGQDFRDQLHEQVTNVFLAQQVQARRHFQLSSASMAREHSDGRRCITAFLESGKFTLSGGQIDMVVTNAKGKIIKDPKAERLQKQQNFRDNVSNLLPGDLTLKRMLQSFQNALSDTDNLFIHLYEVREALTSEFGSESSVKTDLGVSATDWSNFGRLANNEPIHEGRHRGKHKALRPANSLETAWALCFAKELIEAYVDSACTAFET